MFETGDWDDEVSQPQLSALSWAVAKSNPLEKQKSDKKLKKKKDKTKMKDKADKAMKLVSKSVEVEMDRLVNSPSATVGLLSNESDDEVFPVKEKKAKISEKLKAVSEAGKKLGRSVSDSVLREPGYLLRLGEKFQSTESFLRFVGLPGKNKKSKKRKLSGDENERKEQNGTDHALNNGEAVVETEPVPVPPPRKKRAKLDITKLREVLESSPGGQASTVTNIHKTLAEEARTKLTASRFRFLNEKLYTQESNASVKLFKSDPALFSSYHQGYQHQAAQWPLDPLNTIMTDILRQDDNLVIADLGCGEARLARSIPNTVHR